MRRVHVQRLALALLVAVIALGAPPLASAQRGAQTQAQLRATSRGTGQAATRARAQRVSAVLARPNAANRPVLRRYLRDALPAEVERLATAHEANATARPSEHEIVTAARLNQIVRRARAIDDAALPEATIDHVDQAAAGTRYNARLRRSESAVEIETRSNDLVFGAMTTEDGTVGPILRDGGQPAPQWLVRRANGGAVESVSFDSLTPRERRALLRSQSKGRSFFSNRRIPGVRMQGSLANARTDGSRRVPNPRISGRPQRGDRVTVDGVLMNHVEYRGPNEVETITGVEMHVRQAGPAAQNLRDARTVERLLELPEPNRHQHVTAQLGSDIRSGDAVSRTQFVDFYRRVNMVAELQSFEDGYALRPVRDGAVTYFDFLSANGLRALNRYLRRTSEGPGAYMGDSSLKMAAVGFRPGSLYGNERLVGFEVRTLASGGAEMPRAHFRLVTAVQRGLVGRTYGLPRSRIANWYRRNVNGATPAEVIENEANAIERLHYNQGIASLLEHAPAHLTIGDVARATLTAQADNDYSLKLLVHDFANDPVFEGNPSGLRTVQRAQQRAIDALQSGTAPREAVSQFLQRSNLRRVYARSIGI